MSSWRFLEKPWTDFTDQRKTALDSLFLSFFKIWSKLGKSDLFPGLKQNCEGIEEKDICPKFYDGAYLRFQAQYQAGCYNVLFAIIKWTMDIIEQATTTTLLRILILWNILA